MEVVHPICCGVDVHKATLVACLRRVGEGGEVTAEVREFATTTAALLQMADWLSEAGCPVVAMESTGVYWKPVHHVLCGTFEVLVANARDIRQLPGRKTDKTDAQWIAKLLTHGLIRPSYVPPPEIAALRDLTRTRVGLVNMRSQTKNRVHKLLEDTNIKLSSVVSDLFGVSARRMLDALVAGERDPDVLAKMAVGSLRRKIPALECALAGCFTEHHAGLLRLHLELVDIFDARVAELDRRIADLLRPHQEDEVARMATIPGVDNKAAGAILGEIGRDMTRFESGDRLASWAGMCPGNNVTAGKRISGRTRKANKYLRRVLVQCAWSARKTETFLGRTFRRFQATIGGKKAAVAVGHKILVIVYHVLAEEGAVYDEERYGRPSPRQEERQRRNAVKTLERLGYTVALERAA